MTIDLDFVRSQFPALSGEWTYFDNAGGSQILGSVVRRIEDYLVSSNVQHGASYTPSRLAVERVAEATAGMAAWINAEHPSEIVMGPSTSMLIRILATCLGRTFEPGDEVIVTNCDHEANIGPWAELGLHGLTVKTWPLNPDTLDLHAEDLERLMTTRTRLVAVTHASNILGRVNPIKDIARMIHERGAMICVDGVAYAPHRRIDVRELDVDFYALSFYKVYGAHHAMLYGKREHLLGMPRFNHFFIGEDEVPYKFQPGNVNYELTCGTLGLWDYVDGFARAHGHRGPESDRPGRLQAMFETIAAHEAVLAGRLLDYLNGKAGVRIIGPTTTDEWRVPTVSFVVAGRQSDAITLEVDKHKIGIRYGDFYARRLIDDLGLQPQNGVVRASMVHYNTVEELDRLIAVLDRLL